MADYTPIHSGGAIPFTSQASAAIVGGTVVMSSGNGTVAVATTATTAVLGVAAHDAATGAKVTVWPLKNVTHEVTAQGAIAAGALLKVGTTSGTVATIGAGLFSEVMGKCTVGAADLALCRFIGW